MFGRSGKPWQLWRRSVCRCPPVVTGSAARAQAAPTEATTATPAVRPGLLAEIPFTLRNGWIVLDVRVGKDGATAATAPVLHFLLDTGATGTLLSQESLDANHLVLPLATDGKRVTKVVGSGDSSGVETSQQLKAMLHLIVSRPPLAPVPETLVVLPLGSGFQHLGVDGLLGNSFISRFVTEVDYAAHIVRLYDPRKFTPPQTRDGFSALPIHFGSGNIPWVDAEGHAAGLQHDADTSDGRYRRRAGVAW